MLGLGLYRAVSVWQRLSRLLPAPHCSLHPCRDVVCSYLGRRRGRLTGRILLLKLLLLLLLLCALLPVVLVVLPAAGHPCPCMGVPCWAYHCTAYPWSVSSPAPPGTCFLNHRVPRLPQEAAVLACREVLHWLQRWWELPGISWMNKQGQLARAGPGGIRRGTGCSVPCCTHRCLRQGQPSHASTACRKLQKVRSKPCGDFYQVSSLLHHNSTIFFLFLGPPGTRVGPIATGCAWDSL